MNWNDENMDLILDLKKIWGRSILQHIQKDFLLSHK